MKIEGYSAGACVHFRETILESSVPMSYDGGERHQQPREKQAIVTEYTTGLPTAEFADLLIRLREEGVEGYPPSPGLKDSLRAALIYMRHNVI